MVLINAAPISLASGTQTFGPINVPDAMSNLFIKLARCTTATPTFWPNVATQVTARILVSYDGGLTFPILVIGFAASGGIYVPRTGIEAPFSIARGNDAPRVGRKIRAEIEVTNGPLVSQVTVEAL